jgi:hypothetical protein
MIVTPKFSGMKVRRFAYNLGLQIFVYLNDII